MAKKSPSLVPDFDSFDSIQAANFFLQKSGSSVTRCHGQLSSCTISEKTNDPILRKVSDGQTDGQTNKSDFIGCCPTNVRKGHNLLLKSSHKILFADQIVT